MRRQYKGRSSSMVHTDSGEQGFWPSYADMMSAVALILFFLMLLAYIQNLMTGDQLRNTQLLLTNTQEQLTQTQEDLSLKLVQVEAAESDLAQITVDLESARSTLTQQQTTLTEQEAALAQQQADLAAQEAQLPSQAALITEQQSYLTAANDELVSMRNQMHDMAYLRVSIVEKIQESLSEVMGDASAVSIGSNGNLILNSSVLFDTGSSDLKPESTYMLDQLVPVFVSFLEDDENAKYVDSIVISGHTDSVGSSENNRKLSTDRANSVLNYLMLVNDGVLENYAEYFSASGYGETRPVASNDTEEGRTQNRRIEISIILKDDTVMELVANYLSLDLPSSAANVIVGEG